MNLSDFDGNSLFKRDVKVPWPEVVKKDKKHNKKKRKSLRRSMTTRRPPPPPPVINNNKEIEGKTLEDYVSLNLFIGELSSSSMVD
jgi:hypothetical protein